MSFEALHNEILIEIVKYATLDGSTSTLRNLASVNKILNCIAIPMLYKEFDEVNHTSAPKFLRAVLRKPELATYVKSYTRHGFLNGSSPERTELVAMLRERGPSCQQGELLDVSEWDDDDFAACQNTLDMIEGEIELDPEWVEGWMSRIRKGKWHALTGLLLLLLHNLESVELIDYRNDEDGDMEFALGISAVLQESETSSQFALEHLADVSLSPFIGEDDDDPNGFRQQIDYINFEHMRPFLMIPSVKLMAISGLSDESHLFEPSTITQDTNFGIHDLEINNTYIGATYLIDFLRRFTSLRRFSYNHVAPRYEADFLPQEIAKAIAHLRPCLEELELSSMCERNGEYIWPQEIGSLAGFERLKNIEVEGDVLFGYPDMHDGSRTTVSRLCNILPRSLERLKFGFLDGDFPSCEENLEELLRVKEEKFPVLKKVIVEGLGGSFKDPRGLKREFKAKGVRLLL